MSQCVTEDEHIPMDTRPIENDCDIHEVVISFYTISNIYNFVVISDNIHFMLYILAVS